MDPKRLALKLVLDTLGVDPSIETIDDRKRVQKAVYLGQLSGVDLGYRFSWYVMGPYCPALTRDYYTLAEELTLDEGAEAATLRPAVVERLEDIRPLLSPAEASNLSQENWLELLASYHYLRSVSGQSDVAAAETLTAKKPHISHEAPLARAALEAAGLIA
ncbi:MAG: hypothetical protein WD823_05745 [Sulfuricaulis sp.]|uniref:hypothetical protein n=1 Tax=Sulfuricaulis sp. TaxID=2003553 RepID=UPI0034A48E2A